MFMCYRGCFSDFLHILNPRYLTEMRYTKKYRHERSGEWVCGRTPHPCVRFVLAVTAMKYSVGAVIPSIHPPTHTYPFSVVQVKTLLKLDVKDCLSPRQVDCMPYWDRYEYALLIGDVCTSVWVYADALCVLAYFQFILLG